MGIFGFSTEPLVRWKIGLLVDESPFEPVLAGRDRAHLDLFGHGELTVVGQGPLAQAVKDLFGGRVEV